MGLAGLMLTAVAWSGEGVLAPAARLAVLAPVLLVLLPSANRRRPAEVAIDEVAPSEVRRLAPRTIALAVVYLAVGGAPLTVGFVVLSRLYDSWRFSGGYILMLVTAALVALWLTAIFLAGRSVARAPGLNNRATWLRGIGLLIPLTGLVNLTSIAPAGGAIVWVAIAVPLVAGLALGRLAPEPNVLDDLLRESLAVRRPGERAASRLYGYGLAVVAALADALAILEGEYGLLWLLGLIVLLLWVA
jgi:hypothetical protein